MVRSFHSFSVKFDVKRAFFLVSGLKNEVEGLNGVVAFTVNG